MFFQLDVKRLRCLPRFSGALWAINLDRFILNKQNNDCTDKHYCHASLTRIAAGNLIVYKASFFIIIFTNDTDLKTLHLVCFTLPGVLLSSFIPLSCSSHLHSLETALHHECLPLPAVQTILVGKFHHCVIYTGMRIVC